MWPTRGVPLSSIVDSAKKVDPRAGVAAGRGRTATAMCVRLVDVSDDLAIHITTRS